MSDIVKDMFSETEADLLRAMDQLDRINRGDTAGLVDITDPEEGMLYGEERIYHLRNATLEWLGNIEADVVEIERVTGCKRPSGWPNMSSFGDHGVL